MHCNEMLYLVYNNVYEFLQNSCSSMFVMKLIRSA